MSEQIRHLTVQIVQLEAERDNARQALRALERRVADEAAEVTAARRIVVGVRPWATWLSQVDGRLLLEWLPAYDEAVKARR